MCFDFDSNDFTIHLLAVASRFAASHGWREPCRVCSFVFNMSIEDDDSAALFLWGRHDSLISLSSQNFIIFSSLLAVFLLLVVVADRHAFQSERDTVSRERKGEGNNNLTTDRKAIQWSRKTRSHVGGILKYRKISNYFELIIWI